MTEVKLQFEIKEIEPIKDLIRILSENFSDLPKEVQLAVSALIDVSMDDWANGLYHYA